MLILVKDNPRKEKPQFGVMISSYKVKKKGGGGNKEERTIQTSWQVITRFVELWINCGWPNFFETSYLSSIKVLASMKSFQVNK